MVFLTNENMTFAANASGQVSAITVPCNVVAYTGTTKVTPAIGAILGLPSGMVVGTMAAVNNEIPITFTATANATLGGSGQTQGTISIPVTSPITATLTVNWSKVCTGSAGAAGQNAIVFSLYAPNGTTFLNQTGSLVIQTSAYDGATAISAGATYVWSKYQSGSWTTISGQAGTSLSVAGTDVAGTGSYRCQMTYAGKTYQDVITLVDKTDNYQAVIDSTAGDVFKNTIGETILICRLWQGGTEIDILKATTFSVTAPTSPITGTFYYKVAKTTPQMALMRYSGTAWVDVTSDVSYKHAKTYKWYRRDKDGNALDAGNAFATGKTIFVDGDDVDIKTVFVCEVE